MGLATTHDAWHGPYSAFGRWRDWLAKRRGFVLREMIGFGGGKTWSDDQKMDMLYPLLNHSDCDGILTPKECASIAVGLGEVITTTVPVSEEEKQMIYDCKQFQKGCLRAVKTNTEIEFH